VEPAISGKHGGEFVALDIFDNRRDAVERRSIKLGPRATRTRGKRRELYDLRRKESAKWFFSRIEVALSRQTTAPSLVGSARDEDVEDGGRWESSRAITWVFFLRAVATVASTTSDGRPVRRMANNANDRPGGTVFMIFTRLPGRKFDCGPVAHGRRSTFRRKKCRLTVVNVAENASAAVGGGFGVITERPKARSTWFKTRRRTHDLPLVTTRRRGGARFTPGTFPDRRSMAVTYAPGDF